MFCNATHIFGIVWIFFNTFYFLQGQQLQYLIPRNLKINDYAPQYENVKISDRLVYPSKLSHNDQGRITISFKHNNLSSKLSTSEKVNNGVSAKKSANSEAKNNVPLNNVSLKMKALERVLDYSQERIGNVKTLKSRSDDVKWIMNMSEETKRVARQVRRQRPGFFWTLAKVAFETFNDTRSAVQQISQLISDSVAPETTTRRRRPTTSSNNFVESSTVDSNQMKVQNNMEETTTTTTTTSQPERLTRSGYLQLISRNIRGLIRLFNIEWRDAWNQSASTTNEFRRTLGKQVFSYLQDNPDFY